MGRNSLGFEVVREATFYAQRTETMDPQSITVMQREYSHDVVALVSYLDDNTPNRYAFGVPVNVAWGLLGQRVDTFQGYVHHTEPMTSVAGDQAHRSVVKVVCVGATNPMKEKRQRIWNQRTIPSVLSEIFSQYKLSYDIMTNDRVWDSLVQSGESDWQFVCSLAQRLGWTVCPTNTDVRVRPRWSNMAAVAYTTTIFRAAKPNEAPGGLHQIQTFHAVDGETTPDGGQKALRVAQGLDPWQGTAYTAVQDTVQPQLGWLSPTALLTEYNHDTARTYDEAVQRLYGDAENARFYIQAEMEAIGDASVRPGRLVALQGLGAKNDGLWYVEAADHEVSGGAYLLHLSLGRDARWDNGFRPARQRRRVIQPRTGAYGEVSATTPPTVLVSGTWRAAYGQPVKV